MYCSWYRFSLSPCVLSSPWFVLGHMLPLFLFYLSSKEYGIILNHTRFYLDVGSVSLGWMHMLCLGMLLYELGSTLFDQWHAWETYWPRRGFYRHENANKHCEGNHQRRNTQACQQNHADDGSPTKTNKTCLTQWLPKGATSFDVFPLLREVASNLNMTNWKAGKAGRQHLNCYQYLCMEYERTFHKPKAPRTR